MLDCEAPVKLLYTHAGERGVVRWRGGSLDNRLLGMWARRGMTFG